MPVDLYSLQPIVPDLLTLVMGRFFLAAPMCLRERQRERKRERERERDRETERNTVKQRETERD